jgi:predicted nucleic acid-binding protein
MASLYVESSALLKRYVYESESDECQSILDAHAHWLTSRITITEVLINLRKRLSQSEFAIASRLFQTDITVFDVVEFDADMSLRASEAAGGNHLATLDAIHLASALRAKSPRLSFLTYDKRLAAVAKKNGLRVLGI